MIELTAESFTVHASEKISTGDYENHSTNVTVEGSVAGDGGLDEATRKELKARLLSVEKELQAVVQRSAENRIAEPGHENWGVQADER